MVGRRHACKIADNSGSDSHLMMVSSDCRSRRKGISSSPIRR
jgi:hypothetical protein